MESRADVLSYATIMSLQEEEHVKYMSSPHTRNDINHEHGHI